MDSVAFWDLLHCTRQRHDACKKQVQVLIELIESEDCEEIVSFQRHLYDRLCESYRWDLWAVAYVVNGSCGPELFDYFCGWLICQGKEYFETALRSPERAADNAKPGELVYCADILGAAWTAYKNKIGDELPQDAVPDARPEEPGGESWFKEDLEMLYPELWHRFGWSDCGAGNDHPRAQRRT